MDGGHVRCRLARLEDRSRDKLSSAEILLIWCGFVFLFFSAGSSSALHPAPVPGCAGNRLATHVDSRPDVMWQIAPVLLLAAER